MAETYPDIVIGNQGLPYHGHPWNHLLNAGIAFSILFGISMLLHLLAAIRYHVGWQLFFVVGALLEVIGWVGAAWNASSAIEDKFTSSLMFYVSLVIAPSFFAAGIYTVLGRLISTLGRDVSLIAPSAYFWVFYSSIIISLVLYVVGFVMLIDANSGGIMEHFLIAGIVLQLFMMVIFFVIFAMVVHHTLKHEGWASRQGKTQAVITATVFSALLVLVRSILRVIELSKDRDLPATDGYVIALDGGLMLLALAVFNLAQPAWAKVKLTKGVAVTSELDNLPPREA